MKFINREEELAFLQKEFQQKKAKLIPVYGRRRVGKTRLINEFLKGKPNLYFLCEQTSEFVQLKQLSSQIGEFFREPLLTKQPFPSWIDMFEFLGRKKQKYVLVFDEFPYLCQANPAVASLFQKGWDLYLAKSNVFLILSGSSIGMMEKEVLFYKAPLYGRRAGQILLKPFNFFQSRNFFPQSKAEEMVAIYTLLGGIPAYLLEYNPKLNFWQNIRERILPPSQFLAREAEFIVREELREPRTYLTILKTISEGKRKFGEIANAVGLKKTSLSKYLGVLESLHFVQREVPITEKFPEKSKKGLYRLKDNFFNFYFSLVFPFKNDLEKGLFGLVLEKGIKPRFWFLTSFVFEDICVEAVPKISKKNFPTLEKAGRFWDKDTEIDIVGLNEETGEILFGECKWSSKLLGVNVFKNLLNKKQKIDWKAGQRKEFFAFFSKAGFTPALEKLAKKRDDTFLFRLKDLEC